VLNEEKGEVTLFAVNRSPKQGMELAVDLRGIGSVELLEHIVLRHDDLSAINTQSNPDNVAPVAVQGGAVRAGRFTGRLPAASWNVLRFAIK
jgi:alpha-L-arabinofuranosidase